MEPTHLRRCVGNVQIDGDPLEIWKGGQYSIKLVCALQVPAPIGMHQQLGQSDGGSDRLMTSLLNVGKNLISGCNIPWIILDLVDEYAGIESNPRVLAEIRPKPVYRQLSRSFWR